MEAQVKVETNHVEDEFSNNYFDDDDLPFSPANLGEQEVSRVKEEYSQGDANNDDDFPFHITPDNFKEESEEEVVKTR